MKTFTHIGIFKTNKESQIVLRQEGKFWITPNGVSFEYDTPLLRIRTIPKRLLDGKERVV